MDARIVSLLIYVNKKFTSPSRCLEALATWELDFVTNVNATIIVGSVPDTLPINGGIACFCTECKELYIYGVTDRNVIEAFTENTFSEDKKMCELCLKKSEQESEAFIAERIKGLSKLKDSIVREGASLEKTKDSGGT